MNGAPRLPRMNRRTFLRRLSGAVGAASLAAWGLPDILIRKTRTVAAAGVSHGPASGDPRHDSVVLWARASEPGQLFFQVWTPPGLSYPVRVLEATASRERGLSASVIVDGLEPSTRYFYRSALGSPEGTSGEPPLLSTFRTAPAPDQAGELFFTWGGDTGAAFQPFRIFDAVRAEQPHFHIMLGDTIYADQVWVAATLEEYRNKYWENFSDPHLRQLGRTTSVVATWDDHEVSNDFDSTHPRILIGLKAFQEAWPIRPSAEDPNRLYRSFRWGRLAEFFILDTRQYRSPGLAKDGPLKTLLGREQSRWLRDSLLASEANFKFLLSTGPLRFASQDTWSGFATERDALLRFVVNNELKGVLFLTGDMHYASVVKHAEGITEVTVGPMAHVPHPNTRLMGLPEVAFTYNAGLNYGRAHVRARPGGAEAFLSIRDAMGVNLYETRLQA